MGGFSIYAKEIMSKINTKKFKKTLSKFITGVTVVCVKANETIYGKTVNSFNSLSLNPPLVLFSLGNYSSSINVYLKTKYLTINILSKQQKDISNHFSSKNPKAKKIKFLDSQNNTSYITDCVANLKCKLVNKIKRGDHVIFICEVVDVKHNDKLKPLSYFNSKYN
tara:strand:- start:36 stop:533 length:498 start_codon:yes stop_codon:yes gene_type:complete